mgnify:CR=1 FL=1|jgi:hypothetical protein
MSNQQNFNCGLFPVVSDAPIFDDSVDHDGICYGAPFKAPDIYNYAPLEAMILDSIDNIFGALTFLALIALSIATLVML